MGTSITTTDEELLKSFLSGDVCAYKFIYDRYWILLYKHARYMLKNDEEAKDVVQEVFTELWQYSHNQLSGYTLPAFLYTVTRNKILNIIKHLKVEAKYTKELRHTFPLAIEGADNVTLLRELTAQIEAGIESLPPKMREIFLLSRNQHKSYKEISTQLALSDKTVKKQISNALHILRHKISLFILFF
ncbi:RNA polymerase sigma-70 factor [bacterium]|nr:MAG: RNA polymerase sigma-70 factor [bacterium]